MLFISLLFFWNEFNFVAPEVFIFLSVMCFLILDYKVFLTLLLYFVSEKLADSYAPRVMGTITMTITYINMYTHRRILEGRKVVRNRLNDALQTVGNASLRCIAWNLKRLMSYPRFAFWKLKLSKINAYASSGSGWKTYSQDIEGYLRIRLISVGCNNN